MRRLDLHEVRREFLEYLREDGHIVAPSFSLVPKNDPSLLLVGTGMALLKGFFTGEKTPPGKRMTTCQKCLRTGDIDNVGQTGRHTAFFEMLGNFSFGDYFKGEAIDQAWTFLREDLEIPEENLQVTVFEDDYEAAKIWEGEIGLAKEKIVLLGKGDNFWELEVGPSNPCSEIYVDQEEEFGCGDPDYKPDCECDRFIGVWNLVFTQFNKDKEGDYHPLSHPNVDTGMGLEQITTVLQGTDNIFEIDALQEILHKVEGLSNCKYKADKKLDASVRAIADRTRTITLLIRDGVIPSNRGRGYVLGRLLRRAASRGRKLGLDQPFLAEIAKVVIDSRSVNYEELASHRTIVLGVISREEEEFHEALETGMVLLENQVADLEAKNEKILSGERAFKLYDTYGFPVDLANEILKDYRITVGFDGFRSQMQAQKERTRSTRDDSNMGWEASEEELQLDFKTEFSGYEKMEDSSKLLALVHQDHEVRSLEEGQEDYIIVERTPFYPEGGGQIVDIGKIFWPEGRVEVLDAQKTRDGTIYSRVKVSQGSLEVGSQLDLEADRDRRRAIMRNHSIAHLLHRTLRGVLGQHVQQSGSEVRDDQIRFNFSHYKPMTPEEVKVVEDRVSKMILTSIPTSKELLAYNDTKKQRAVGLFKGRCGGKVRVVTMGDLFRELCGRTHIEATGDIGNLKILSGTGIVASVRRIESATGLNALKLLRDYGANHKALAAKLRANEQSLLGRVNQALQQQKELRKEVEDFKKQLASSDLDSSLSQVKEVNRISYITGILENVDGENLRNPAEETRGRHVPVVVVLASIMEDKVLFVFAVTEELTKQIQAGKLIGKVAKIAEDGGDGRPDFAQTGGRDPFKVQEAINAIEQFLAE